MFVGYLIGIVLVESDPVAASCFVLAGTVMFGPALFVLGPAFASVFPSGHLLPGWWARAKWLSAAAIVVGAVIAAFAPGQLEETIALVNPAGIGAVPAGLCSVGSTSTAIGLAVGGVVGPATVIVRYRRSSSEVQHQLRWFMYAGLVSALVMPVSLIVGETWTAIVALVALGLIPVAAGEIGATPPRSRAK